MNTLKTIIDSTDLTNFDWQGYKITDIEFTDINRIWIKHKELFQWNVSIADLLVNPSFCKCLFGNYCIDGDCVGCSESCIKNWRFRSGEAFELLQESEQKSLDYIADTKLTNGLKP